MKNSKKLREKLMARQKSEKTLEMEKQFLQYKEVVTAIERGLGDKKGVSEENVINPTVDKDSKDYQSRQSAVIRAVNELCTFMGLNPYEIVERARLAQQDGEVYRDMQEKLTNFLPWLMTEREPNLSYGSAKTYRGDALSLIKWNTSITFRLNHKKAKSNKKKRNQKLGVDNQTIYDTLKLMLAQGDLEMRAFIALGMCAGWRPGDLATKFDLETLKVWLEKDLDYFVLESIGKKGNADLACCLGRWQQKVVSQYIETINDNRVSLFGDCNAQRRLSEKFTTLLKQVYKGDDNIVTPHSMRSLIETWICMKHGYNPAQAYKFTGHKENGVYIQLTSEQLIEIFKVCEQDLSMQEYIPVSSDFVEVKKVVKMLTALSDNRGKITHCFHEFNGMDSKDKEKLDSEKELEMECATFMYQWKESLYEEFRARLISEIQEGKITL